MGTGVSDFVSTNGPVNNVHTRRNDEAISVKVDFTDEEITFLEHLSGGTMLSNIFNKYAQAGFKLKEKVIKKKRRGY